MKTVELVAYSCILMCAAVTVRADAKTFDFQDPKGVNAIGIHLDSLLEPITGLADGISGTITFDPARPEATRGAIVVDAASIRMSNSRMTKVLHSEEWINVTAHQRVTYSIESVDKVEKLGDAKWKLTTTGVFTLCGIANKKTVTMTAAYLPGKAAERNHQGNGDLLILRSDFSVDRTAYGIKPDMPPVTVAKNIDLNVGIVGTWEASE